MNKIKVLKKRRLRRKRITRKRIHGTNSKPRLSVFKSNKYIYIQAINDDEGETILSYSSVKQDKKDSKLNKKTAEKVGEEFGKKLIEKKIDVAVFDRNGYLYTGRVKALADGIRKAGVKF